MSGLMEPQKAVHEEIIVKDHTFAHCWFNYVLGVQLEGIRESTEGYL